MDINALKIKIEERVPDFEIRFKNESKFMKLLGKILFFNKGFMDSYITTIGSKVYWPNREALQNPSAPIILAHEYVHIMDNKNDKLFKIKYLFPQILSVFSLFSVLSFVSLWFYLFLLFLLALLPFPAPFRKKYEMRGYGMSIKASLWNNKVVDENQINHYAKQFSSKNYYWMWPFDVKPELQEWNNSNCPNEIVFKDVYDL